jgi:geranylgeranyl diphosphate synthase type I
VSLTRTAQALDAPAAPGSHGNPVDEEQLRQRVDTALIRFLDRQDAALSAISPQLAPMAVTLRDFLLDGGKRLRPAFCYWGWRGAGGGAAPAPVAAPAPRSRRPRRWSCCRRAPWSTTT